MQACVLKDIHKVTTAKIVKWVVKLQFKDDGVKMSVFFLPSEARWKVPVAVPKKNVDDRETKTTKKVQFDKQAKKSSGKKSPKLLCQSLQRSHHRPQWSPK